MNENLENKDWIKEAPTLASLDKKNAFFVPVDYFEQNATVLKQLTFLDSLSSKTIVPFHVPDQYFEQLSDHILTKISIDERIGTEKNSFSVPENYFETLENRVAAKITGNDAKKPVKILRLWQRNLMKYASAACFVIIAAGSLYFYQSNKPIPAQGQATDFTNEQILYDIDEHMIIDHINTNTISTKKTSASDTEMENYILNNYSPNDLAQEL